MEGCSWLIEEHDSEVRQAARQNAHTHSPNCVPGLMSTASLTTPQSQTPSPGVPPLSLLPRHPPTHPPLQQPHLLAARPAPHPPPPAASAPCCTPPLPLPLKCQPHTSSQAVASVHVGLTPGQYRGGSGARCVRTAVVHFRRSTAERSQKDHSAGPPFHTSMYHMQAHPVIQPCTTSRPSLSYSHVPHAGPPFHTAMYHMQAHPVIQPCTTCRTGHTATYHM